METVSAGKIAVLEEALKERRLNEREKRKLMSLEARDHEIKGLAEKINHKKRKLLNSINEKNAKNFAEILMKRFEDNTYAQVRKCFDAHEITMTIHYDAGECSEHVFFMLVRKSVRVTVDVCMDEADNECVANGWIHIHGAGIDLCHLRPLSSAGQEKWQTLANALQLDGNLCKLSVFTELVISLMSPLFTSTQFTEYFDSVMHSHNIDGTERYSGHGGRMKVTFPCAFAETPLVRFRDICK